MTFGNVLRSLRKRYDLTQKQLADVLGISESTVGMYERSQREPDFETQEAIADYFNVDMDYLLGRSQVERRYTYIPAGFQPMPELENMTPLVGDIACGSPITAEENVREYIPTPKAWRATFALECHGDSMAPKILDGDVVAIRKQPQVENGQIAAVRIGDKATLKRVFLYPGKLVLQSENASCEPIVLMEEEMESVTIEGLAVGLMRNI